MRAEPCRAAFHVEVVIMPCRLVFVFADNVEACFDRVRICEAGWAGYAVRVVARKRT